MVVDLQNLKITRQEDPIIEETQTEEVWVVPTWIEKLKQTETDLKNQASSFDAQQTTQLPTFKIKTGEWVDQEYVNQFVERSIKLWKTKEEIERAYEKWLAQWMFDKAPVTTKDFDDWWAFTKALKSAWQKLSQPYIDIFTWKMAREAFWDVKEWARKFGWDISKIQRGAFAPIAQWQEVDEWWVETWLLWKVITRWLEREKAFSERKAEQWDIWQTWLEKWLDIVWEGFWVIQDTIWEWFISALWTVATDEQAESFKQWLSSLMQTEWWEAAIRLAQKGWEAFAKFEEENPRLASQARNLWNFGLTLLDIAWLWAWEQIWKQTIKQTTKQVNKLDDIAKNIINTTKKIDTDKAAGLLKKTPVKEVIEKTWDIIWKVAKAPVKASAFVATSVLWKTTWAWREAIEQAFKSWWKPTFAKALKWEITDIEILQDAKRWLETIKEQRKALYWEDYKKLIANKNQLDITDIQDDFIKQLDEFKIKINEDWSLNFDTSKLTQPKSIKQVEDIYDDLFTWKDTTPEGLDVLKQRIADRWTGWEWTKKWDLFSTSISNKIKNKIIDEVPEYKNMNKAYEEATDLINDIQKTLALGDKSQKMTAITRLNQAMKDNIAFRKEAVELLEKSAWIDLKTALAGAALRDVTPRGLSWILWIWIAGQWAIAWTLFAPTTIAYLLAASPRVIWETARAIWVSVKTLKKWLRKIKELFEESKKMTWEKIDNLKLNKKQDDRSIINSDNSLSIKDNWQDKLDTTKALNIPWNNFNISSKDVNIKDQAQTEEFFVEYRDRHEDKTWVVIDSDNIKKMFIDFDPKKPELVHRPSSDLSQIFYEKALAESPAEKVVLTAWWGWSWKSEVLLKDIKAWEPSIIFDWTWKNFNKMVANYDKAAKAWKKPQIDAVFIDFNTAKKFNQKRARTVPEDLLRWTHTWYRETLKRIIQERPDINVSLKHNMWIRDANWNAISVIIPRDKIIAFLDDAKDI